MLWPTNPKPKLCYERALEAKQRALNASDELTRNELLASEARWLKLAKSYELSERLANFLKKRPDFPKHPICPNCQVPMWLLEIQSSCEKVEYLYECKVCEEKTNVIG